MGEHKTSDHININIRMQNPGQEPPESSKAPNQDFKDMDDLCDNIQIKIKLLKPSQEHLTSSKIPNLSLKDMDVLLIYKVDLERRIWNIGVLKTRKLI